MREVEDHDRDEHDSDDAKDQFDRTEDHAPHERTRRADAPTTASRPNSSMRLEERRPDERAGDGAANRRLGSFAGPVRATRRVAASTRAAPPRSSRRRREGLDRHARSCSTRVVVRDRLVEGRLVEAGRRPGRRSSTIAGISPKRRDALLDQVARRARKSAGSNWSSRPRRPRGHSGATRSTTARTHGVAACDESPRARARGCTRRSCASASSRRRTPASARRPRGGTARSSVVTRHDLLVAARAPAEQRQVVDEGARADSPGRGRTRRDGVLALGELLALLVHEQRQVRVVRVRDDGARRRSRLSASHIITCLGVVGRRSSPRMMWVIVMLRSSAALASG